jgi:hypothetical protein
MTPPIPHSASPGESSFDLGTVQHLSSVRLNDRDLGVVWCSPWQVSVPAGLLGPVSAMAQDWNQSSTALTEELMQKLPMQADAPDALGA